MQGEIIVESELHKGSKFSIRIPCRILGGNNDLFSEAPCVKKESCAVKNLSDKKVLIVDDTSINVTLLEKMLQPLNLWVDTATSAKVACKKIDSTFYDLILLDIEMPIMNGYQLADFIRREGSIMNNSTPIIATTAYAFHQEIAQAYRCGVNACITKPFLRTDLWELIYRYLEQPAFDLSYLQEISNGDIGFINTLKVQFLEQSADYLNSVLGALQSVVTDSHLLRRSTHSLKSSFAAFGATRLSQLCEELECKAMQEITEEVITLGYQIRNEYLILSAQIKKL